MAQLSTSRTLSSTAAEHLADHLELHTLHNTYDLDVGQELAYAERQTVDTTTNTGVTNSELQSNLINGLSFTIVGNGRPVEISVYGSVRNSTVNAGVGMIIMCNGDAGTANAMWVGRICSHTTHADTVFGSRRMVLTNGVSYTFEVAKQVGTGTGTYEGQVYRPMWLAAIQR